MKTLLLLLALAQNAAPPCSSCAAWNIPQKPFQVYGNTYYVGTHGLSSILVTSDAGHILIDGALQESAPLIAANIKSLGFRVKDIQLIVNSHAHFDHAGGIAQLQRLSGARVVASTWSASVLTHGAVAGDDPQFGTIRAVDSVHNVTTLRDGETLRVGKLAITAHVASGHTPGGTSWTWTSCEASRCLAIVYADSVSPISADGFRFSNNPAALAGFEKSFAFLDTVPCDILLTPHPREKIDPPACRHLADEAREQLRKRLESEKK